MRTIRVGVLGTGCMGRTHAVNLLKIKGVNLAAVCGRQKKSAESMIKDLGASEAAAHEDFDWMLSKEKLDALYVCLPPSGHNGQVVKAAAKGLHLFLEKPVALRPADATAMALAIRAAGVVCQVGYHQRFGAAVQKLKEMLDDGSAGRPTLFQARFFCNHLHSAWWRRKELSGGQVFEQAIHQYDLAMYFFGKPSFVSGMMSNLCHQQVEGYTVEDTSVGTIRFANGAMASIVASNNGVPMRWVYDCRVVCGKVTVDFVNANEATFWLTGGPEPAQFDVKGSSDLHLKESEEFVSVIQNGGRTRSPIEDGVDGIHLVSLVCESSSKEGRPLLWDVLRRPETQS